MDIHTWRTTLPSPPAPLGLNLSEDESDASLPELPIGRIDRIAASAILPDKSPQQTRPSTYKAPTLVAPKQPSSGLFLKKPPQLSNTAARPPVSQHGQVIEIEDSPPSVKHVKPQNVSSAGNFRASLTAISSSSSNSSLVQLDANRNKIPVSPSKQNKSGNTASSNSHYRPEQRYAQPAFQSAKDRIRAEFQQPQFKSSVIGNGGVPLGGPRDPTLYASHSGYRPAIGLCKVCLFMQHVC